MSLDAKAKATIETAIETIYTAVRDAWAVRVADLEKQCDRDRRTIELATKVLTTSREPIERAVEKAVEMGWPLAAEEVDAHGVPREVHERGWQWRPVSNDTAFAPPFGTIRVCPGCGCLVAGGPTACAPCAEDLALTAALEALKREPTSTVEPAYEIKVDSGHRAWVAQRTRDCWEWAFGKDTGDESAPGMPLLKEYAAGFAFSKEQAEACVRSIAVAMAQRSEDATAEEQ